jgi:flagellar FliL protein
MTEDAKDKEAKDKETGKPEAGAAAAAPAAPRAPLSPLVVLIAVVVLAVSAGAALGGLLLAPRLIQAKQAAAASELANPHHKQDKKKKDKKEKHDKKGEPGKSPVYKLDNIIVNPADSEGQRFLMCTVAIVSEDSKELDVLREHEIELRDRVVTLLSKQPMSRLTSQAARDSLRMDLLGVILPTLGPDGREAELKIYLPQFVVQ